MEPSPDPRQGEHGGNHSEDEGCQGEARDEQQLEQEVGEEKDDGDPTEDAQEAGHGVHFTTPLIACVTMLLPR